MKAARPPITIAVKPGTLSGTHFRIRSLRRLPRVGECVWAKEWNVARDFSAVPGARWERWRVTEIHGERFVLERF